MSTDQFKTEFLSRFVLFLACIRHGIKKLFNTDKHRGNPFIILHMKSEITATNIILNLQQIILNKIFIARIKLQIILIHKYIINDSETRYIPSILHTVTYYSPI